MNVKVCFLVDISQRQRIIILYIHYKTKNVLTPSEGQLL